MSIRVCHLNEKIVPQDSVGAVCVEYSDQHPGGIEQHDRVKSVLTKSPYIKWDDGLGEPVEMSQAEKDQLDLEEENKRLLRVRMEASSAFDGQFPEGQYLRALVKVLLDEMNTLRSLHSLQPRTLAQAKNAIKNAIDNGDVDE